MSRPIPPRQLLIIRIVCALLLLAASEGLRRLFTSFKKPPVKIEQTEKTHYIEGISVSRSNHRLELEGYGIIRSAETITFSSEVSGKITFINKRLESGFEIHKGETLFEIDKNDFELSADLMKSKISVINARINEAKKDMEFVEKSILLRKKELDLAQKELRRQIELLDKNIGSDNNKDVAEKALLASENMLLSTRQQLSTLESAVTTFKEQKKEAENALKIEFSKIAKCTIKAPKDLRVVSKHIEEGQIVSPGTPCVSLEDPAELEIPVKIPGPEIIKWLQLNESENDLFKALQSTPARIFWIEGENLNQLADGTLTRIEKYNSQNRMIEAVVSLKKVKSVTASGMFCKVLIRGREIKNVFRIPRVALTKYNQAMVVEHNRIKFYSVEPVYSDGDFIMVKSDTLSDRHIFVNSKIASPVEGMKAEVEMPDDEKG